MVVRGGSVGAPTPSADLHEAWFHRQGATKGISLRLEPSVASNVRLFWNPAETDTRIRQSWTQSKLCEADSGQIQGDPLCASGPWL